MSAYTVTWGEESYAVFADSEQDAWSKFSDQNDLAKRQPKLHERVIVKHEPLAESAEPAEVVDEPTEITELVE